jgi:hypothetical protein
MARRTRHKNNKNIRRTRGGGGKPLKNQKITFTLFVGEDGVYLQKPKVEKGTKDPDDKKLSKSELQTQIKEVISGGLTDYNLGEFKTAYESKSSAVVASPSVPTRADSAVLDQEDDTSSREVGASSLENTETDGSKTAKSSLFGRLGIGNKKNPSENGDTPTPVKEEKKSLLSTVSGVGKNLISKTPETPVNPP